MLMKNIKNIYYGMWAKSILDVRNGSLRREGSWKEILIPLYATAHLFNVLSVGLVFILIVEITGDSSLRTLGVEFITKGNIRLLVAAVVAPASLLSVYFLILRRGRYRKIVRDYGRSCKIRHPMYWYAGVSVAIFVGLALCILLVR